MESKYCFWLKGGKVVAASLRGMQEMAIPVEGSTLMIVAVKDGQIMQADLYAEDGSMIASVAKDAALAVIDGVTKEI